MTRVLRVILVCVAVVLLAVIVGGPLVLGHVARDWVTGRVDDWGQEALADGAVTLASYERGWASSHAVIDLEPGRRMASDLELPSHWFVPLRLDVEIAHGPWPLNGLAIADTVVRMDVTDSRVPRNVAGFYASTVLNLRWNMAGSLDFELHTPEVVASDGQVYVSPMVVDLHGDGPDFELVVTLPELGVRGSSNERMLLEGLMLSAKGRAIEAGPYPVLSPLPMELDVTWRNFELFDRGEIDLAVEAFETALDVVEGRSGLGEYDVSWTLSAEQVRLSTPEVPGLSVTSMPEYSLTASRVNLPAILAALDLAPMSSPADLRALAYDVLAMSPTAHLLAIDNGVRLEASGQFHGDSMPPKSTFVHQRDVLATGLWPQLIEADGELTVASHLVEDAIRQFSEHEPVTALTLLAILGGLVEAGFVTQSGEAYHVQTRVAGGEVAVNGQDVSALLSLLENY